MAALDQIALFDDTELPAGRELLLPEAEQRSRFTADVVARNRERYLAIVGAIGEGIGVRQICRAFGVSHHTVNAIRERDPELVATEKERARQSFRFLVRLAADRLREALEKDEISPSALPVALGILVDKSLALEGQPSMVVTVRRELDQESVRVAFMELAREALDSKSREITLNSQQKEVIALPAVADVVNPASPDVLPLTLTLPPPQTPASDADPYENGGGGGRDLAAPTE